MSEKKKLINETTNNKIKNNYINQINNSITNTNIKEKNISIKLKSNTKRKDEYLKTFLFLFTSFLFLVKIGLIQYILSITYPPMKEKLIPIIDFHTPKEKSQNENKNNIEFNIIPEYEVPDDENELCKVIEPFEIMRDRFKVSPIDFCRSSKSNHVCYINNLNYFIVQRGVICKMQNVVIDPSKWKDDGYTYNGPSNNITRGCPILEYGFFNMKCDNLQNKTKYNYIYENYFDSWNYNYKYNEKYEELARGKIIFFISRNQDSPNLYFGFSGIINALSMIYYFKLDPENIQVVFLESMRIDNDPYYDFYKYLISRGGEPIHVRDLKKKYLISEAVHVPINWDSPCFILYGSLSSCKYQVKGFHYLNEFINKYMNIPDFIEPINYNKEIFYYPKMIVEPNSKIYIANFNSVLELPSVNTFDNFLGERAIEIIETEGDPCGIMNHIRIIILVDTLFRYQDSCNSFSILFQRGFIFGKNKYTYLHCPLLDCNIFIYYSIQAKCWAINEVSNLFNGAGDNNNGNNNFINEQYFGLYLCTSDDKGYDDRFKQKKYCVKQGDKIKISDTVLEVKFHI